jgi:hypothetical protein
LYLGKNVGVLFSRPGAGAAAQFLAGARKPHKNDAAPHKLLSSYPPTRKKNFKKTNVLKKLVRYLFLE